MLRLTKTDTDTGSLLLSVCRRFDECQTDVSRNSLYVTDNIKLFDCEVSPKALEQYTAEIKAADDITLDYLEISATPAKE